MDLIERLTVLVGPNVSIKYAGQNTHKRQDIYSMQCHTVSHWHNKYFGGWSS